MTPQSPSGCKLSLCEKQNRVTIPIAAAASSSFAVTKTNNYRKGFLVSCWPKVQRGRKRLDLISFLLPLLLLQLTKTIMCLHLATQPETSTTIPVAAETSGQQQQQQQQQKSLVTKPEMPMNANSSSGRSSGSGMNEINALLLLDTHNTTTSNTQVAATEEEGGEKDGSGPEVGAKRRNIVDIEGQKKLVSASANWSLLNESVKPLVTQEELNSTTLPVPIEVQPNSEATAASTIAGDLSGTDAPEEEEQEEDVVISSSEILDDNSLNYPLKASPKKAQRKENKKKVVENCTNTSTGGGTELQTTYTVVAGSDRFVTEFRTASGSSGSNLNSNSIIRQQAPDQDMRHYLNSRLLLQILVVGLFGLVSVSLMIVYTIKFCVCRRRKRLLLLRRNLVADSATRFCGHHHQQQQQQHIMRPTTAHNVNQARLPECTCPIVPNLAGLAPDSLVRLESLMTRQPPEASQMNGFWSHSIGDHHHHHHANFYHQIDLAHHQGNHSACALCLTRNLEPISMNPQSTIVPNQQDQRPPAYSELFGSTTAIVEPTSTTCNPPPSLPVSCQQQVDLNNNNNNNNHNNMVTLDLNQSSLEQATSSNNETNDESSGSIGNGSAAQTDQQQQQNSQKNLLVKLNLNKTKLLSADDLVLLSKLIDVPIIVQQQQQQSPIINLPATSSSTSCTGVTIDDDNDTSCGATIDEDSSKTVGNHQQQLNGPILVNRQQQQQQPEDHHHHHHHVNEEM